MPESDILMFPSEMLPANMGKNPLFDFATAPTLNLRNYSDIIPQTPMTRQFDYSTDSGMFPEEMPNYNPEINQNNNMQFFSDDLNLGSKMLAPDIIPANMPSTFQPIMPGLGEKMFPDDMSQNMGYAINDKNILLDLIESTKGLDQRTKNITQKRIRSLTDEIQKQRERIDMMLYRKNPNINDAFSIVMDNKRVINASSGYEEDIKIFMEEIKNPPMWRVLG